MLRCLFGCKIIKFRRHVSHSLKSTSCIELIFTMCETFKWIKLLVVESQKDDLQIPVKISLGKWLSFAGHMACHSFVAFFNRCSFDNGSHDLAYLSLTHPLCFVPNVALWLVVDVISVLKYLSISKCNRDHCSFICSPEDRYWDFNV